MKLEVTFLYSPTNMNAFMEDLVITTMNQEASLMLYTILEGWSITPTKHPHTSNLLVPLSICQVKVKDVIDEDEEEATPQNYNFLYSLYTGAYIEKASDTFNPNNIIIDFLAIVRRDLDHPNYCPTTYMMFDFDDDVINRLDEIKHAVYLYAKGIGFFGDGQLPTT